MEREITELFTILDEYESKFPNIVKKLTEKY